ncbi:MAG: YicC/YloC family endoribonuclease [Gammaproteobacteria bacterium]
MIRSMTAFARQERRSDWGLLTWELRSVNHRYLEVHTRLPEEFRGLESAVRQRVSSQLKRGKVDCNLRFRANPAASTQININRDYLQQLLVACHSVEGMLNSAAALNPLDLLGWPGVIQEESQDITPLLDDALQALDSALEEMVQTRQREGDQITAWITARGDAMEKLVEQASQLLPDIQAGLREKLLARLSEINIEADAGRLEQELVFMAQKTDVSEELDRLNGHLHEMRKVLQRKEPVGRRLDFLMQEFNREANTFGSKSVNAETTRLSVELKVLIEQMREQVQNVE